MLLRLWLNVVGSGPLKVWKHAKVLLQPWDCWKVTVNKHKHDCFPSSQVCTQFMWLSILLRWTGMAMSYRELNPKYNLLKGGRIPVLQSVLGCVLFRKSLVRLWHTALSLDYPDVTCRTKRRWRATNTSNARCCSTFARWYGGVYLHPCVSAWPKGRGCYWSPSSGGWPVWACMQDLCEWREPSQLWHACQAWAHQAGRRDGDGTLPGWYPVTLLGDSRPFRHHCQSISQPRPGWRLRDPHHSIGGQNHWVHGPKARLGEMQRNGDTSPHFER